MEVVPFIFYSHNITGCTRTDDEEEQEQNGQVTLRQRLTQAEMPRRPLENDEDWRTSRLSKRKCGVSFVVKYVPGGFAAKASTPSASWRV